MSEPTVLLIPQKDLNFAKSRLVLSSSRRRRVAVAMLRGSLRASSEAQFEAVVVVLDNPHDQAEFSDLDVVPFWPGVRGLNEALVAAEEFVRTSWGPVSLAVMPSDLPLVTPQLLNHALACARGFDRAYIADRSSAGTTLLFAGPGVFLNPAYGAGSAAAHLAQGAHRIDDERLAPLRHDVDDVSHLAAAGIQLLDQERWDASA